MNKKNALDTLFVIMLIIFILLIAGFNYFIDPYYIFRDSTIKGINDVKTHKYTNKRVMVYSYIKLTYKHKDTMFTGNCLLSHYGIGLDNVAFYTLTYANAQEIKFLIENVHKIAPNIKTIYWGFFYNDFFNQNDNDKNGSLTNLDSKYLTLNDFINLFFSYNTTKYSIKTLKDSIQNKGQNNINIYPYREIAGKTYAQNIDEGFFDCINDIRDFCSRNDIKLVMYYTPMHVTKKIDLYEKGIWKSNQIFKKKLAGLTDFYDYSLFNKYNDTSLDETNKNYVDNMHPSTSYNNIIVKDLLSSKKEIGVLINSSNVDKYLEEDTKELESYMKNNKELVEKIKNLTKDDANIAIKKEGN